MTKIMTLFWAMNNTNRNNMQHSRQQIMPNSNSLVILTRFHRPPSISRRDYYSLARTKLWMLCNNKRIFLKKSNHKTKKCMILSKICRVLMNQLKLKLFKRSNLKLKEFISCGKAKLSWTSHHHVSFLSEF